MPRRPDMLCAGGCGKLLWRGRGCLPEGESVCRDCRKSGAWRTKFWCACGAEKSAERASQCGACAGNQRQEGAAAERRRKRHGAYISKATRQAVYERDNYCCVFYGSYVDLICAHNDEQAPTVDHIIPISKGGLHGTDNLRTAHRGCNGRRGNGEAVLYVDVP